MFDIDEIYGVHSTIFQTSRYFAGTLLYVTTFCELSLLFDYRTNHLSLRLQFFESLVLSSNIFSFCMALHDCFASVLTVHIRAN